MGWAGGSSGVLRSGVGVGEWFGLACDGPWRVLLAQPARWEESGRRPASGLPGAAPSGFDDGPRRGGHAASVPVTVNSEPCSGLVADSSSPLIARANVNL